MNNITKPRKVRESSHLNKNVIKKLTKFKIEDTLAEVLETFELSANFKDNDLFKQQNNVITQSIRYLLSSLQSLLNRKCNDSKDKKNPIDDQDFEHLTLKVLSNINNLLPVLASEVQFPETITLAALCIAFLLINYYSVFEFKFVGSQDLFVDASLEVYFTLFKKTELVQSDLTNKFSANECFSFEDSFSLCELNFRTSAILCGFLSCSHMIQLVLSDAKLCRILFLECYVPILNLCRLNLINHFHNVRLLTQFWKTFNLNKRLIDKQLECDEETKFQYHVLVMGYLESTISLIDNNWECHITGVPGCVKQAYEYVIKLCKMFDLKCISPRKLVCQQIVNALIAPYSSKAKYKKMSILLNNLSHCQFQCDEFDIKILKTKSELPGPILLHDLIKRFDSHFAVKVLQHLTINSLASSISEFYKCFIESLSVVHCDTSSKDLSNIWSDYWLTPFVTIFNQLSGFASLTVVQNALLAHVFPVTLQTIPDSFQLLMGAFQNNNFIQVSLTRIQLKIKKHSTDDVRQTLPQMDWLQNMLLDCEDMVRLEALDLLVEEKLIKDRSLTFAMTLHFIYDNMNIDNATFRQRMVTKLERFYKKLIHSVCDKYQENDCEPLPEQYQTMLTFLLDTLKLCVYSFYPGSSFQRKYTALNIFGSFLSILANERSHDDSLVELFQELLKNDPISLPITNLLMFSLIDKDDKIRRLSCEVMIKFHNSSLHPFFSNCDTSNLNEISYYFIKSPRHQECHIGSLVQKYLLRTVPPMIGGCQDGLNRIKNLIFEYVREFGSIKSDRSNLMSISKTNSLHGWILALNQCLTFDSFFEGVFRYTDGKYAALITGDQLRDDIFKPCIYLAMNSVDFFIRILLPMNLSDDFSDNLNLDNFVSPSFHEMCVSIEKVVQNKQDNVLDNQEVSSSNDFQLILSMCWLNIKESNFLMTSLVSLFADCLLLLNNADNNQEDLSEFDLILPSELYDMGMKLVMVMLKCRHKGVIEASGLALTKLIRNLLRIQSYLIASSYADSDICYSYQRSFETFIMDIWNIVKCGSENSSTSSITRRSAGLAFIVQAILVGESEAVQLDGIRLSDSDNQLNLYDRTSMLLMTVASTPIPNDWQLNNEKCQQEDLPQANALHVLNTIIGTSALSDVTCKTIEQLFQMCIHGFTSPFWQIRNASLQLFGSCITRLLGQKKYSYQLGNVESSGDAQFGCTITLSEFASKHPIIFDLVCSHLKSCVDDTNCFRKDLVPVLALLASFTPTTVQHGSIHLPGEAQLKQLLHHFLSSKVWKIRMLAAKSLANLLSFEKFECFVQDCISNHGGELSSNSVHGLLCLAQNLLELQRSLVQIDAQSNKAATCYKNDLYKKFEPFLIAKHNCSILKYYAETVFNGQTDLADDNLTDKYAIQSRPLAESNGDCINFENEKFNENDLQVRFQFLENMFSYDQHSKLVQCFLWNIHLQTQFKQPSDVRLAAAEKLQTTILNKPTIIWKSYQNFVLFTDIMLTLLEDEERPVRRVAQGIVCNLLEKKSANALSLNTSIEFFIDWLYQQSSLHNQFRQFLVEYLLLKVNRPINTELVSSIIHSFQKQSSSSEANQNEIVLFEKEEKNVFAEPFMLNIKLGYLLSRINQTMPISEYIESHSYLQNCLKLNIETVCLILQAFDSQSNSMNDLLYLSIWKLPKFMNFVITIHTTCSFVLNHPQFQDFTDTFAKIEDRFPFLSSMLALNRNLFLKNESF